MMTVTSGRKSDPYANIAVLLDKPAEAKKLLKQIADAREAMAAERAELSKAKTADQMLKSAATAKKRADEAVENAKLRAQKILEEASGEIASQRKSLAARERRAEEAFEKRSAELDAKQSELQAKENEIGFSLTEARSKLDSAKEAERRALDKEARVDAILDDLKKLKTLRISAK